jgi:HNH endonuclease
MRYQVTSLDFLKQQLADLQDDPTRPWSDYPCLEWPRDVDGDGYGILRYESANNKAHRVAYLVYIGPIPSGLFVCHRCDNPACFRPSHLFAGTAKQNTVDMIRKGRKASTYGERNGGAKLTEEQVQTIRAEYSSGGKFQHVLAAEYGVNRTLICMIVNRKRWRHIT